MKLSLHVHLPPGLRETLRSKFGDELCGRRDHSKHAPFWIESDEPSWVEIMRLASKGEPVRILSTLPVFSLEETKALGWFEPQCRSMFPLSDRAFSVLAEDVENSEIRVLGWGARVRILKGVHLGAPKVKPKYFSCPESGPYVFVARRDDYQKLVNQGISGMEELSILDNSDRTIVGVTSSAYSSTSYHHVCVSAKEENGFEIVQGRVSLVFDEKVLSSMPDVFLSSESFGDGVGRLIVSKRFRHEFERLGYRGISFLPVLSKESSLYQELQALWKVVLDGPVAVRP